MEKILNIVNGDAPIDKMKEAGIEGEFLPWRDFLHEGPVLTNLSLDKLSKVRANFIANLKFGEFKKIYKDFQQRDKILLSFSKYEKVILWFEHDLYDQLQLLQILSWFEKQNLEQTKLTFICTDNYLGESSVQLIKKFLLYEREVFPEHLKLAKKAWEAFGEPTPKAWFELLQESTGVLPFLQGAIFRMLEEYPNTKCGLSRSEYQALMIISNGIENPEDIFEKYQSFEERKFMGDIVFYKILEDFETYKLVSTPKNMKRLSITPLGKKLLNAEENWLNIKPLNRSIGGVNLNIENLWCWDMDKHNIKQYYFSKALNALLLVK